MKWPGRDPYRRLLGDQEMTPGIARASWEVARDRGLEHPDQLVKSMNSFEVKALREELQQRLDRRAAEAEDAHVRRLTEERMRKPRPFQPVGRLGYAPSGAIVDLDAAELDDARERARADSLANIAKDRLAANAPDAVQADQTQAALNAQLESELPAHLRRR